MANEFRMLQGANRNTHNELLRERRWRAMADAFMERRMELAGIPPLSEDEKERIRAEINEKFPDPPRDWE